MPPVAAAYANRFGPVETSRLKPCPKIQGVWQLSKLSDGTFLKDDGQVVEHFRWFMPMLFNLSVRRNDHIAIDHNNSETVLYLADSIPSVTGQKSISYSARPEAELPCLGHGWRKVSSRDHAGNHAASRVLRMVPEQTKKILQTDYIARNTAHELLLAIHIEYLGTDQKQNPVNENYWHFLKMPRQHANPAAQGFKY